jgi:hypothetical protein
VDQHKFFLFLINFLKEEVRGGLIMRKLIFFITIILVATLVVAVPSIPNHFSGDIFYTNNPSLSLVGHEISASIKGDELGVIGEVKSGNSYEVLVDPQGKVGTITFFIGGIQASPTSEYQAGEFTTLDLNIDEEPIGSLCGNDNKESGEQCDGTDLNSATCESVYGTGWTGEINCDSSCSFDDVNCIPPETCVESWTCTEFSSCSSGSQSRTCSDANLCGTTVDKPIESQTCDGGSSSSSSSGSGSSGGNVRTIKTITPPVAPAETLEPTTEAKTKAKKPLILNTDELAPVSIVPKEKINNNAITGAATDIFSQRNLQYGSVVVSAIAILAILGYLGFSRKKLSQKTKK